MFDDLDVKMLKSTTFKKNSQLDLNFWTFVMQEGIPTTWLPMMLVLQFTINNNIVSLKLCHSLK